MKKLLIVVGACFALTARSQTSEFKNFLYLNSDSIVYAEKIRLQPSFSGNLTLRVDNRRVPLEQVKFFNGEDGFFANTKNLDFLGERSISERIISGKINLYQRVDFYSDPYDTDYYRFGTPRPQAINTRMFYNKGFSDLKMVNYNSLMYDMADNLQSLEYLKQYRRKKNTGILMYVMAGAALVAGSAMMLDNPDYEIKKFTGGALMWGLSLGLATGGYFIQQSAPRNIQRAFEAYNQ